MSRGLEDAERFIREAKQKVYVRRDGDRIRIIVDGKSISIPYDEETYKRLYDLANEVREQLRSGRGTEVRSVSDVSLFMTTVRGRKPLVEHLMEKLTWFQKAVLDIGSEAFIAVLLASGEDPNKIPQIVEGTRDVDKFKSYVLDKFYNLVAAGKDSSKLIAQIEELREEVNLKDAQLALLEEKLGELSSRLSYFASSAERFRRMLEIAMTLMTSEQLDKYTRILSVMGLVTGAPQTAPTEGGGK